MSDHAERDPMDTPITTLRAILEAIPHPGGLEALDELEHRHASDNEPRTGHTGPNHCADPRR